MKHVFAVIVWNGMLYDDLNHETIIIVADDEKEANELALNSTRFGGNYGIPEVLACILIPHLKSDIIESNVFRLTQN